MKFFLQVIALVALTSAIAAEPAAVPATLYREKLSEIDSAVSEAISEGRCPGGVLWIEHRGAIYRHAYGKRAVEPAMEEMTEDTIFDAASLTKVIATAPSVMKLVEQGKVELDAPVSQYLAEFRGAGKENITVRQLLTHTSGLRPGLSLSGGWTGPQGAYERACAEPLPAQPGTIFRYSDINFILLGELVHRVSGVLLNEFCEAQFFVPLGMKDTHFLPEEALRSRIAPTERAAEGVLRGVVHDPTSRRIGGVAGHAGLFTTAADLARFARMFLRGGELDGVRVLQKSTVALMTSVQTPPAVSARRGLGWDIDSPYAGPRGNWFPVGSYGHTGWTGGSVWIDPYSETFVIFLSNRNHPTEKGNVLPLRRLLGTLTAEAVSDFNFAYVPSALASRKTGTASPTRAVETSRVLTGIDVLERDEFRSLQGMRVGLVTNQTGIDSSRRSTIDILHKAPGVQLVALFSPEHGIRGMVDEKVPDGVDGATGLPIYSLYGANRVPSAEQLAQCDAIVFDIQDIGCRFYTYISTLGECLTAAGKYGKKIFVLDRPNPIGGTLAQGPLLTEERSFVAWHPLPVRHGMTVGELARMFNAERKLNADLTVIGCKGWSRSQWGDATLLPWVNPSPNMRSLTSAAVYPGVGLLEFCNLSVGRGTDRPFELLGAPYIDDRSLAAEMNALQLPGVQFVPVRFTPTASVFSGKECGGVQVIVTDREALDPPELGIALATVLNRLYPKELQIDKMSRLLGNAATLDQVRKGADLVQLRALWAGGLDEFRKRREQFLLYR